MVLSTRESGNGIKRKRYSRSSFRRCSKDYAGEWTKIEARLSIPEGIEDYQHKPPVCPPGAKWVGSEDASSSTDGDEVRSHMNEESGDHSTQAVVS